MVRASISPPPPRRNPRVAISPRARAALRRLGLETAALSGSGPSGRIVEADVVNAARASAAPAPLSEMRRAIARRTSESFATIPHFYVRGEADLSALLAARTQWMSYASGSTVKVTLTDFFLRALALALRDSPAINQTWVNDTVQTRSSVAIGLVVATPEGIVIPILHQADRLDLLELAAHRTDLAAAARARRLPIAATQGGTVSLSNLGAGRVDEFDAIIPTGQSGILAVGRVAPRPWVVNEELTVRPTVRLCLSVDHRIIDGVPAAHFLENIITRLEHPDSLGLPPSTAPGRNPLL